MGMKLAAYRAETGISREEFARRIKVKNGRTVQRYEQGRVPEGRIMLRIEQETQGKVRLLDFIEAE